MESFIYSGVTKDQIPVAVCGFCAEGETGRILRLLGELSNTVFGPYTAGYIIDYRLNEMMHTLLSEVGSEIAVLGATAGVPGAEGNTGGIFGDFTGRPLSSEDTYRRENGLIYGVRPGYAAFCVRDHQEDEWKIQFFSAEGKADLIDFYHALAESGREFLFLSDGSGEEAFGMVAVQERMVTLDEVIHRRRARREFRGVKRIGIFGGTFDPIHYGHLTAAEAAREALGLDLVVFMPNGNVPYRRESVTGRWLRYEMLYQAVRSNPGFCVSDLELTREGFSFAADTVKEIRSLCDGDASLTFLMGADVLPSLPRWRDFSKLASLCRFAVLTRPGYGFDEGIAGELCLSFHAELTPVSVPSYPVSSSEIRQRIVEGRSIRYLLPESVEELMGLHRLYVKKDSWRD
ncbi:nicotinate-nucleotide adenylyltransferase [Clostridium transplantifaecale]|uniref:nicotinate-nucleotide adenylyltransferase n=1 Tax=Clostridium transplantifaecale TaxID=2479838 RepID=UPI000F62CA4B|nr:nicotinate-nucleotide adenylyltransferase [Clostridium transplantifaecale]